MTKYICKKCDYQYYSPAPLKEAFHYCPKTRRSQRLVRMK